MKIFLRRKSLSLRPIIREENKFVTKLLKFPKLMILSIFLIISFGMVMMYSAGNGSFEPWAKRQTIHIIIGVLVMLIAATVDTKFYYNIAYIFYFICLTLLFLVEIKGYKAMGATRWLNLGIIKLQPSDLMKISIILALGRYFHSIDYAKIFKLKFLIIPILMIIAPLLLILKQPDLGTAIILGGLAVAILFISGIKLWKFMVTFFSFIIVTPFIWNRLHDYQKNRITTFINPDSEPLGAGYNIIQSKIAIGSAGLYGKGYLKGSQSQLSFLPERQTDFIFTMFAEEWGFTGCLALICLYSYIIYSGTIISVNCKNHFGRLISIGVTYLLFLHIFINIAMVMGLLPVVGVPLPLMSYGGTITVTSFIAIGLLINVHIHKKLNINKAIKSLM